MNGDGSGVTGDELSVDLRIRDCWRMVAGGALVLAIIGRD